MNIWTLTLTNPIYYFFVFVMSVIFYISIPKMRKALLMVVDVLFYYLAGGVYSVLALLYVIAVCLFYRMTSRKMRSGRLLFIICAAAITVPFFLYKTPMKVMSFIGFSYFTMMAYSYMYDSYKGKIKESSIINLILYLSFFPCAFAGPIERYNRMSRRFDGISDRRWIESSYIVSGVYKIVFGLFEKLVLADRVAIFTDVIFGHYHKYSGTALLMAVICYALQIYFDFAACSLIACGTADLLGIPVINNFQAPYLARNLGEIWNRWHISLSEWLRDYVYIPLGGGRHGKLRKYCNLMITFLISGIWHSASFHFLVWGGINGMVQILRDMCQPVRNKLIQLFDIKTEAAGNRVIQVVINILVMAVGFTFFRMSIFDSVSIFRIILTRPDWAFINFGWVDIGLDYKEWTVLTLALMVVIVTDVIRVRNNGGILHQFLHENLWVRWCVLFGLIISIALFGEYGFGITSNSFIYTNF